MRSLAFTAVVAVVTFLTIPTASCDDNSCDGLADCALDEICDRNGSCIPAPPALGVGVGEGEGEVGEEGEGEGEGVGFNGATCATLNEFDADEMYMIVGLAGGGCTQNAVARAEQPASYAVGWGCLVGRTWQVRSDGSIAYLRRLSGEENAPAEMALFVPDPHPFVGSDQDDPTAAEACAYPETPTENDVVIATPGCGVDGVARFAFQPTSTSFVYGCADAGAAWFTSDGAAIPFADAQSIVVAYAGDGAVLVSGGSDLTVHALPDGTGQLVDFGGAAQTGVAFAALDTGFLAATVPADGPPVLSLWEIDSVGTAVKLGEFQQPEDGQGFGIDVFGNAALTSDGTYFDHRPFDDVVRLSIDSPAAIFDATAGEPIRAFGAFLFSGAAPGTL